MRALRGPEIEVSHGSFAPLRRPGFERREARCACPTGRRNRRKNSAFGFTTKESPDHGPAYACSN